MLDADPAAVKLLDAFAGDCLAHQGAAEDAVIETREADIELGGRTIYGVPVQGKAWPGDGLNSVRAKLRKGKGRRPHAARMSLDPALSARRATFTGTVLQCIDCIRLGTKVMW
jgi:hypothetical protein